MFLKRLNDCKSAAVSQLLIARATRAWRGKTARDFSITFGSNFTIALSGAIGGVLAARLLGPEGRGELAAAVVWASVLGVIATLGLPQALTYFAARESAAIGSIFKVMLLLLVGQSILVLIAGQLAVNVLLTHSRPAANAVRIYLFSVPCSLLTTYLSTLAQGLKRFELFNALRVAPAVGYVIILILASILNLHRTPGIVALLLVSQVAIALSALALFLRRVHPVGQFDRRWASRLLGYGLKSYWGSLSWMANARLDQFVMSAFVDLNALGQYAVAVSYATAPFPLSGAFAMILFPRVASETQYDGAKRKIVSTFIVNLLVSGSGAILLGLLCPVLLPWLFGNDFHQAIYPATVLLGGTVFLGCNYVLSDGLRGLGNPLTPSVSEAVGVVVTLVGLLLLLPRFGIWGAAWISVISYGIVLVILVVGMSRVLYNRSRAL